MTHTLCLACAWLALAAAGPAGAAALTLDEAARLALIEQPRLTAQETGIAALREEAIAAGQLPDPKLVVGVEGLPTDSFSLTRADMTQTVIGLSQMIPGRGKRALAERRVEQRAEQVALALAVDRRRVERDVRLAWLEVYAADAALTLARRTESEFQRLIEWSQVAYKTGQLGQDDSLAMRAEAARASNRVAEAEGRLARARAGLARWIGVAAQSPLAPLTKPEAPADLATLSANLANHPELQAIRAGVTSGQLDSEMARLAYRPDWSVDLAYGIRGNDRPDTLKLMVGLDLPLFPARRQDRQLAARLAEMRAQEAMLEDRARELDREAKEAHADWQAADQRLTRLETDILPLATRRIDSALSAYKTGRAGYDRVLEARRAELDAHLEKVELEVARAKSAATLQYYQ